MTRTRASAYVPKLSCIIALTFINIINCQLHLPQTRTEVDRTAFIVNFDEVILAPVSVAAMQADAADTETVRDAAQQLSQAAAQTASRIMTLAQEEGINVQLIDTYGHVMSGMAVRAATPEEGARLARLLKTDAAVKMVHPVVKYQVDLGNVESNSVEAAAAADPAADPALVGPAIWGGADHATLVDLAQTKYSGAGVRVAVIDDGLDYTHPAFGACTAINSGGDCRVIAGHDFTDGDSKTYDVCGPHGTHVAGIIGGDSSTGKRSRTVAWRGVAYKALLGAYRVFDCYGTTQNDWLLSALERAVKDRMTVINLSMGTSYTAPLGIEFTTRLAKQGVMVVAAAGNSGDDGLWTYGAPASEPDSFAVGSTDNTYSLGAALTIDADIKVRGETTNVLAATARAMMNSPMFSLSQELVLPQPRSACWAIQNKAAVAGKVAVVPLGECGESDKALNLINAGATSVVFYDNRPFPAFKQSMNIDESIDANAPQMFCVDEDTGVALTKLLAQGKQVKLTSVATKKYLNPNAEHPSWFSSWGPDSQLRLLPTFSAPGGGILSSIPGNNFALFQGTSMATPYATGALALWRHANSNKLGSGRHVLDAAKAAFVTTAMPIKLADDERFAHSVVQAGAGMIQVKSAIDNTVEVSPSYLSLPTGQEETTSTITLTNTGSHACAYQLGHTPAVSISTANAWYEQEAQIKLAATVKFTTNTGREITTLNLKPGDSANIKVIVTTPDKLRASPMFYSGYLTLTPLATSKPAAAEADVASVPGRRMLQDTVASAGSSEATDAAAEVSWYPALSIPYLSLSQKYSSLEALAGPRAEDPNGRLLVPGSAYLCNLFDGTCAMKPQDVLESDPLSMEAGSNTFALPLSRPMQGAYIEIFDTADNKLVGRTDIEGPIAWGGLKSLFQLPEMVTGVYWSGEYTPSGSSGRATGKLTSGTYKFSLVLQKPVALGDQAAARATPSEYLERLEVLGQLKISEQRHMENDSERWVPFRG